MQRHSLREAGFEVHVPSLAHPVGIRVRSSPGDCITATSASTSMQAPDSSSNASKAETQTSMSTSSLRIGVSEVKEAFEFFGRWIDFLSRMVGGPENGVKRHRGLEQVYKTMGKGKGVKKATEAAGGAREPAGDRQAGECAAVREQAFRSGSRRSQWDCSDCRSSKTRRAHRLRSHTRASSSPREQAEPLGLLRPSQQLDQQLQRSQQFRKAARFLRRRLIRGCGILRSGSVTTT